MEIQEEIYGQWFYNMLDDQEITLNDFLELKELDQANMWFNYIPKNKDGFEFFSDMEWRLDNLYGDIVYENWKYNKIK